MTVVSVLVVNFGFLTVISYLQFLNCLQVFFVPVPSINDSLATSTELIFDI